MPYLSMQSLLTALHYYLLPHPPPKLWFIVFKLWNIASRLCFVAIVEELFFSAATQTETFRGY